MSIEKGPLDLVRALNHEAGEMDRQISGYNDFTEEANAELQEAINKLDGTNPLLNKQVAVAGDILTPGIDEYGESSILSLPYKDSGPGDLATTLEGGLVAQGYYNGYFLMDVYDPKHDDVYKRLTHMVVHSDLSVTGVDGLGRIASITETTMVCADGSYIEPTQPIDAHSFEDLQGDRVFGQLRAIVEAGGMDRVEKLRMIGKLAHRLFEGEEFQIGLNKQRLSYLNGSTLFRAKPIRAKDFMFGTKDNLERGGDGQGILFSDMQRTVDVYPEMFDVSFAYCRTGPSRAFIDQGQLDVYSSGRTEQGVPVLVPLKSLLR